MLLHGFYIHILIEFAEVTCCLTIKSKCNEFLEAFDFIMHFAPFATVRRLVSFAVVSFFVVVCHCQFVAGLCAFVTLLFCSTMFL